MIFHADLSTPTSTLADDVITDKDRRVGVEEWNSGVTGGGRREKRGKEGHGSCNRQARLAPVLAEF